MEERSRMPVKFAYWVPNVSGGLVVSTIEQRTSHEPAYNVEVARAAERVGFEYALTQVRYLASYGADAQHESTSFSLALLLATEKIKVIAAVHPFFWHPGVLAKFAATAQELTGNRLALNVVSGWFKDEATQLGVTWHEHDERYRQSEEFISLLRGVWSQDGYSQSGDFFSARDITFRPQPRVQPELFQGGNSTAAQAMAGRVSDWYFMNGKPIAGAAEQVRTVGALAAAAGRRIRFGLNGFAVVRETREEARAVLEEIIAKADVAKVEGFGAAVQEAGNATKDRKGMWADSEFRDLVQYNDGFRTGLVGTPDEVARRVLAYSLVGVDLLLLGFLHVKEEVEAFGELVIPRVRELEQRLADGEDLSLGAELDEAVTASGGRVASLV
ncbi:dimethylsulfone monooxygenase SfnG [Kineococcus indalonis]|uniref:dimethylsulfone monooxygenase SfnG n=1 Tax=Kineococcus indalonis TaxID=2696566 RepID=UPI001F0E8AC6|nr:dimethyl sulfone monooxygenase SfnG [Kineococcus indalonis]